MTVVNIILPMPSQIRDVLTAQGWSGGKNRGDGYTRMSRSYADSVPALFAAERLSGWGHTVWVEERPDPPATDGSPQAA